MPPLKWIQTSQNASPEMQQRRRLQLALAVLVIALFVVVIRDLHDMGTPAPANPEPVASMPAASTPAPATAPAEVSEVQATPAQQTKSAKLRHSRNKRPVVNAAQLAPQAELSAGPSILATDRAVLPPLEVSVVAGNQNRPLTPRSNSVNVDMQSEASANSASATSSSVVSDPPQPVPAPKVTLSRGIAERVSHSVAPSYPLLAKQMKVQGAVVLQALIDKGGHIQSLRVVSGPAILAAAAQEAVKQWRFKPYYQHGEPVETEARVSVNFTISTF
jgi:TonB family protein